MCRGKSAVNIEQLYQSFFKTLLLVDGVNKLSQIRHGVSGQTIRDN
jgi:L-threonylcarbamoyladenylate synthase